MLVKNLFLSATVKLTAWYLLIIMVISLVFSAAIYQIVSNELNIRLQQLQTGIEQAPNATFTPGFNITRVRTTQLHEAQTSLLAGLAYVNLVVFFLGGVGSYLLARRALEPIRRAHDAQARFASDASHELRTPLAAMKAELEVALRSPRLSNGEVKELLTSNLEEVDRLTYLTHTLLSLSRLDRNEIEITKLPVSQTIKTVAGRFPGDKKRLNLNLLKKPIFINANPLQIEELFTILIDNALKYSPPKSKVNISIKRQARHVHIQISNAGKGISPDELPLIFERFYRADSARTHTSYNDGFGLGLSLAKEIVRIHNGEIIVSSEIDKQTTFTIVFPLHTN